MLEKHLKVFQEYLVLNPPNYPDRWKQVRNHVSIVILSFFTPSIAQSIQPQFTKKTPGSDSSSSKMDEEEKKILRLVEMNDSVLLPSPPFLTSPGVTKVSVSKNRNQSKSPRTPKDSKEGEKLELMDVDGKRISHGAGSRDQDERAAKRKGRSGTSSFSSQPSVSRHDENNHSSNLAFQKASGRIDRSRRTNESAGENNSAKKGAHKRGSSATTGADTAELSQQDRAARKEARHHNRRSRNRNKMDDNGTAVKSEDEAYAVHGSIVEEHDGDDEDGDQRRQTVQEDQAVQIRQMVEAETSRLREEVEQVKQVRRRKQCRIMLFVFVFVVAIGGGGAGAYFGTRGGDTSNTPKLSRLLPP